MKTIQCVHTHILWRHRDLSLFWPRTNSASRRTNTTRSSAHVLAGQRERRETRPPWMTATPPVSLDRLSPHMLHSSLSASQSLTILGPLDPMNGYSSHAFCECAVMWMHPCVVGSARRALPCRRVEAGRERKGGEREREHRDTISLSVFFFVTWCQT